LRTTLEPEALLLKLLAIERKFGREREFCIPNGPRTLDLDLLLMEGVVCSSTRLVLPHLRLHNRRFVLMPLAEIAPDLLHTTRKESMAELLRKLPVEEGDVVRIG
jgi:2-amino-4-hydroxy-6-hydroxymethyldihydropteridine diphosphokinase